MKVKDIADYIDDRLDNLISIKNLDDRGLSTEYHNGIIKGLKMVKHFIEKIDRNNTNEKH